MSTSAETLPQERQQAILDRLREHGRVTATELAALFGVSEDSIRRDLHKLAAQGVCRRVYGGALLPTPAFAPLPQRREENSARKQALARAAVKLVRPGQVLLLDAGSTNYAIATALPERQQLTVVTNAPDIAQCLMAREGFEILMIGGRMEPRIGAVIGAQALEQLRRLRADLCFPGACAVDAEYGLWATDSEEALFKRRMIEVSSETAVVVTTDKLGALSAYQVVELDAISHIVVEKDVAAAQIEAFRAREIQMHEADPTAGSP
ncbi:MAG: DeoR/GlpR transcriptional regulator [Rudaea sp.]|uniref:DeoR/GlpR family DNA-binding transcription regulator n=1 Tax=unclassified Rudaea TaxID=2627037 RepID=UPI0010F6B716|nr:MULTISPECIES: DeoR/GlpR family DNA-binding transcription regulator [unclassified Rudaea]MBN8888009.1 DeoR/GlpR transcriptional regulator [Rudaea sp.]MBR0346519.1 DeoR/GlpR transcriptional regulator [Rudaea sp.]